MPATEQTWRDAKLLHVVFGISSIVMFVGTIWLLADDHFREWKENQRKFHELESWTIKARNREQQRADYQARADELDDAVTATQNTPPAESLVKEFVDQMRADPVSDDEETIGLIEAAYQRLIELGGSKPQSAASDAGEQPPPTDIAPLREDLLNEMRGVIKSVKFVEDYTARKRKFRLADYDAQKSKYDLGVRDNIPSQELQDIQRELDVVNGEVGQLTLKLQATQIQRGRLQEILDEITHDEDAASKLLSDHLATRDQLEKAQQKKTGFWATVGHTLLQMPIIDAFGRPLTINQIWLPELTLNNNFREVARFDRCTTCHTAIDKTAPGSAVLPGYPPMEDPRDTQLATPAEPPSEEDGLTTEALYGLEISESGVLDPDDVVVGFVWPKGPAAEAGLQRGDVITHIQIGDRWEKLTGRTAAMRYLLQQVSWGSPISLRYRRGVPNPFNSHPRLDLFVGSLSPHKLQEFGCTICHEGQGSATEFKWASHTPNTPAEAAEWAGKHGWFDNHHWIFPMRPQRFVESNCLKCHHQVEELLPSERFPEPPAPTLVHGYQLVKKYGCYGCHEINGYDGQERIGPDLRNEPPYAPAAQQLAYLMDSQPDDDLPTPLMTQRTSIRNMAEQLAWHPEDAGDRRALYEAVQEDANRSRAVGKVLTDPGLPNAARELARTIKKSPDSKQAMEARTELVEWLEQDLKAVSPKARASSHNLAALLSQPPLLSPAAHRIADLLKDSEHPGTLRRVGPSLRYIASKLGTATMNRWITKPQDIRPTSKMPRLFSLHDHLQTSPQALATAREYEPVEIRAVTHYLASRSQPFPYAAPAPEVTEPPDAERGKVLFETRGCLACHQHEGTPQGEANHGPNLTNLAEKLRLQTADKSSKAWLRSWLLAPDRYHRRTVMPNTYLAPEPLLGKDGKPVEAEDGKGRARMTDPAADIAEYLLGSEWKGSADELPPLTAEQQQTLSELALTLLKTTFPTSKAEEYLKTGISNDLAASLKGAEVELLGEITEAKLLSYVGSRTMTRAGCAGCHDIPGFEGEKPIGTTMADWGRKETSKLAFEHITHYVESKHGGGHGGHGTGDHDAGDHDAGDHDEHADAENKHTAQADPAAETDHEAHHLDPVAMKDSTAGFFVASLQHHQREGFLWQKLNEPRSYDYKKAENKPYHDRLRMPLFSWGAEAVYNARQDGETEADQLQATKKEARQHDIQAIMTFVLGLVAEPPASKYIYHPNPRREAIVEGEAVLAKFNCAGCHVLELDRWDIAFRPDEIDAPSESKIYPFLRPHFSAREIEQSKTPDWRDRLHAELVGMPRTNPDGHPDIMAWLAEDEEFIPLDEYRDEFEREPDLLGYSVELWEPALLDGQTLLPKDPLPTISQTMITRHIPARGGDYARLLLPIALDLVRQTEPGAAGADAWAWVPPPLIGQGRKTQQAWLTEFLLRPHPIRPGVLLRMPKFNISRHDAARLAQYFAATAHASYPNQYEARRTAAELEGANLRYQQLLQKLGLPSSTRLGDALQLVVNKAGCVQCHSLGNLQTDQAARAAGPNLGAVYRRLQTDYLKHWIAKPSFTLPYTKMQELIPYDKGFLLTELDKDGKPELDDDGNPKMVQVVHGTATQQLQAVVDLLANFGEYLEARTSIRGLVERPGKAAELTASAEPE